MTSFENVKVGDRLPYWFSGRAGVGRIEVERVTPTQIIDTKGTRWRIKDGDQVGYNSGYNRFATTAPHLADPNDTAVVREFRRQARDNQVRRLDKLVLEAKKDLSTELLDEIRSTAELLKGYVEL